MKVWMEGRNGFMLDFSFQCCKELGLGLCEGRVDRSGACIRGIEEPWGRIKGKDGTLRRCVSFTGSATLTVTVFAILPAATTTPTFSMMPISAGSVEGAGCRV